MWTLQFRHGLALLALTFYVPLIRVMSTCTCKPEPNFAHPKGVELSEFRDALDHIYRFESALESEQTAQQWKPAPLEEGHNGRYLWTDAFGVCDFLTLHGLTGETKFLTCAHNLIETVHGVLGKTRDGRLRLPGATDDNPLGGGLRIGKLAESGADGDGQYHHYLTVWMFALNRYSVAAKDPKYNSLAIQCAKAIHPKFVVARDTARPRMYWKMAMDLSRPLVSTQGNRDPFDGYTVFSILDEHKQPGEEGLEYEMEVYKKMMNFLWSSYHSSDSLGLGMTLWTAAWKGDEEWARFMKDRAVEGLRELEMGLEFDNDTRRRLAFREFGAVMGVKCHDEFAGQEYWWSRVINKVLSTWRREEVVPVPKQPSRMKPTLVPITNAMYSAALIPGAFRKGWVEDHMKK
ncbi:hypothetical protein LshimejAT787_1201040 [Lyophyllum shimeji]|uniref:Uncharacterized protein n=1 Tax=Lyophyllum shimeji TaxID=47721 RepID=A0A9P3USM6_LYOSH|nr:hypothetical protein LshimejAT787_1201040 [Lyophyllum shimeji]